MSSAFKPGDVVQLQSGGPAMTVLQIVGDDYICCWLKGAFHERGAFEEMELIPYEPPSKA